MCVCSAVGGTIIGLPRAHSGSSTPASHRFGGEVWRCDVRGDLAVRGDSASGSQLPGDLRGDFLLPPVVSAGLCARPEDWLIPAWRRRAAAAAFSVFERFRVQKGFQGQGRVKGGCALPPARFCWGGSPLGRGRAARLGACHRAPLSTRCSPACVCDIMSLVLLISSKLLARPAPNIPNFMAGSSVKVSGDAGHYLLIGILTLDAPRTATVLDPLSGPPFCGFLRTMRMGCGLHGIALVSSNH